VEKQLAIVNLLWSRDSDHFRQWNFKKYIFTVEYGGFCNGVHPFASISFRLLVLFLLLLLPPTVSLHVPLPLTQLGSPDCLRLSGSIHVVINSWSSFIEIRDSRLHKFRHQEVISWREYIPYKNTYTNNLAEQTLLTVWKPGHDRELAETGNWDHDFSIHV